MKGFLIGLATFAVTFSAGIFIITCWGVVGGLVYAVIEFAACIFLLKALWKL